MGMYMVTGTTRAVIQKVKRMQREDCVAARDQVGLHQGGRAHLGLDGAVLPHLGIEEAIGAGHFGHGPGNNRLGNFVIIQTRGKRTFVVFNGSGLWK